MALKQKSKKSSKKHSKRSRNSELIGDSTLSYDVDELNLVVDPRSKKAVQKKLKQSSSSHKKKRKNKKQQSKDSVIISDKSSAKPTSKNQKAPSHTKIKKRTHNTEQVDTQRAHRRLHDKVAKQRNLHRKMAVYAVSDKPTVNKACMIRAIRSAHQSVCADAGLQNHRFSLDSLGMIHQAAEDFMTNIFYIADMLSTLHGKKTISVPELRFASAISSNEMHMHMSKKRKREILKDVKGSNDFTFMNPEEILQDCSLEELRQLNVPEKFKMEQYLPGDQEPPSKKRKLINEEELEEDDSSDGYMSAGL